MDKNHAERAKDDKSIGKGKADAYEDYRKVLDRKDIDAVIIGTPDHWHAKILHRRHEGGQGRLLREAADPHDRRGEAASARSPRRPGGSSRSAPSSGRDHNRVFLLAVALVRDGPDRQDQEGDGGDRRRPDGRPVPEGAGPARGLNWDMWLGQAPKVDYIKQRCHYDFRWWYEYSGGKLTDWGAHHVDIAQWAIGMDETGPTTIEVAKGELPVEYKDGWPPGRRPLQHAHRVPRQRQVPQRRDDGDPRRHRERRDLRGRAAAGSSSPATGSTSRAAPSTPLYKNPVPESILVELRKGKKVDGHMPNFFECMRRPLHAGLRRLDPPPRPDHLPPGQHRHPPGRPQAPAGTPPGRRSSATPRPTAG